MKNNTRSTIAKKAQSDLIFDSIITVVMLLVFVATLYPFLNVLAISLNQSNDTVKGGIYIWPRVFTMDNYKAIFGFSSLSTAFKISALRTVIGTILGLISASMLAYVLTRKDFQARKLLSTYLAVTLYVSGGLIPSFLLIRDLHMMATFWVYVIPGIVSAFNVFMVRSYMDGLPAELHESARMDGAGDFTIYLKIILPLCKPVLATIALFLAVGQWNSWFDTYLYNGSAPDLTTLQYELMKILQSTQSGNNMAHGNSLVEQMRSVSPDSVKMAITMVTVTPIIIVYPFLQNYFVKGMTLGAVKA